MDPPQDASVDIREYLSVFKRRKWMIAAVTVAAVILAAVYSFLKTPVYEARAEVLVSPITTDPFGQDRPDELVQLDTERKLVLSTAVAKLARKQADSPLSPEELLDHVAVEAPAETRVLEISYTDTDPGRAQSGAQAFADAYLEFKRQQALDASTRLSLSIQSQLQDLESDLREANRKIESSPDGSAEERDAVALRDALTTQIGALRGQLASISTLDINPGQVIEPAELPSSPATPNHRVDLALGLFVGAFLGVGLALLRDRASDRVRGRRELEALAGVPVLAVVPRIQEWHNRKDADLVTRMNPMTPAAEAYRTLRTSLLVMAQERGIKTLLVVSPSEGEGKTVTAANLGVVLAEMGKRVVLISADLRKPRLHEFFGMRNELGLTNVLLGQCTALQAALIPAIPNLIVLPSGPCPSRPAELLQSERMLALLAERPEGVDFIIIDAPPLLPVADSLALSVMVDGVLMVANGASTTQVSIAQARDQLRQVGARLVGAVFNNADSVENGYYTYGAYGEFHSGSGFGFGSTNGHGVWEDARRLRRPSS